MPSISCPYCQHVMELKGIKPGSFKPACPACRAQFQLTISPDPAIAPQVVSLEVLPGNAATLAAAATSQASAAGASAARASDVTVAMSRAARPDVENSRGRANGSPPSRQPAFDETVAVGLSDQTVQNLARQPVIPAWEAAARHVRLGGYEIIKTLGEGGMGKVYLANQTSLARNVALKVLAPRLASDSQFIARFTREAFAAAQLSHHNVVQIHDIGVERSRDNGDTNFFSMEFVEGHTLGAVTARAGQLDPQTAVGYVLQAARGLKFAHDHGLIHRDVKPDNLLLNTQGVVKVADLGLVKRAGVSEPGAAATLSHAQAAAAAAGKTLPSAVMGTPDYMPPEQARDAGTVDARADIYSLGCTLYQLLTGRAPFAGRGVEAVLAAHASEAVVPPERLARNVPPALSQIVLKMLAKRPEDRYANMGEVVAVLEQSLGVESEKPFSPEQEQLKLLELSAERFNSCGWKSIRTAIIRGFLAIGAAAIIVLALPGVGYPLLAAGLLGFMLTTIVSYQLIHGIARRTFLMSKIRQLVFGSSLADWATYFVFTILAVGLLIAFGLHWIWVGFSIAAVLTAAAFYGFVDVQLASERRIALEQTEKMLKTLRLRGNDENTVRHFVCRYCGRNWEEFYEALFGFESKLQARQAWNRGELGRTRPRFAAWREPIIAWIDRHAQARQEERQRKLIVRLESEALQAGGLEPYEANIQARQSANRLMDNAAAIRDVALKRATNVTADADTARNRAAANTEPIPNDWMYDGTAYKARRRRQGSYLHRRYGSPLDIAVGRGVRVTLAMLLLIGFGLWWSDNGANAARNAAADLVQAREDASLTIARDKVMQAVKVNRVFHFSDAGPNPLRINHVPDWLCDAMGCWNGGIAGALLLFSVFFGGRLLGATAILATAVALLGRRLPISAVDSYEWLVPAAAVTLWLLAVLFLRDSAQD